ncbi:glutamic acid-rich protein-like [Anopheles bellator]|uniref:glutamic acid-rich protein-like n=1 Tax=Anopheles bellator TaxID=139047 RepID=UPI0026484E29|nr:glutamic acid-rich protein-like [Anopheles bellator]
MERLEGHLRGILARIVPCLDRRQFRRNWLWQVDLPLLIDYDNGEISYEECTNRTHDLARELDERDEQEAAEEQEAEETEEEEHESEQQDSEEQNEDDKQPFLRGLKPSSD